MMKEKKEDLLAKSTMVPGTMANSLAHLTSIGQWCLTKRMSNNWWSDAIEIHAPHNNRCFDRQLTYLQYFHCFCRNEHQRVSGKTQLNALQRNLLGKAAKRDRRDLPQRHQSFARRLQWCLCRSGAPSPGAVECLSLTVPACYDVIFDLRGAAGLCCMSSSSCDLLHLSFGGHI